MTKPLTSWCDLCSMGIGTDNDPAARTVTGGPIGDLRGLLPGCCRARGVAAGTRLAPDNTAQAVRHTVAVGQRGQTGTGNR